MDKATHNQIRRWADFWVELDEIKERVRIVHHPREYDDYRIDDAVETVVSELEKLQNLITDVEKELVLGDA